MKLHKIRCVLCIVINSNNAKLRETVMATQVQITNRLSEIFGRANVISEWSVANNSQDDLTHRFYCPRIDIVVGPFNIDRQVWRNNARIIDAYQDNRPLFTLLQGASDVQNQALEHNDNPRCLLAIEIENRTGTKHRMGSILNASAIGAVGIMIVNNPKSFESMVKIREYLKYLNFVGKTNYNPQNIMILLSDNFYNIINRFQR
jgi:hypothetical protein